MTTGDSIRASRVRTIVRAIAWAGWMGCVVAAAAPRPAAASCPYPVQADLHGEYWTDYTVPSRSPSTFRS